MFKKGLLLLLVALLTLTAFIAGCGPIEKVDETGPVTFRYGQSDSWADSMNPYAYGMAMSDTLFYTQTHEYLLQPDQDLKLEGRLAESWSVSDDDLTWTFNLRKGVKWHDGKPFTAKDVYNSYAINIEFQMPRTWQKVRAFAKEDGTPNIEIVDDHTIKFTTLAPKADILDAMILITPEHIFNQFKSQEELLLFTNEEPFIGTGPFVLDSWAKDEFSKFVANDDYWGGRPIIDEFMVVMFANRDTMLQALQMGEIDLCNLNAAQVDYAKGLDNIELNFFEATSFTQIGFNSWADVYTVNADGDIVYKPNGKKATPHPDNAVNNPLILDYRIRTAMDYAIDYDRVIEYAEGALGRRETSIITSVTNHWGWVPPADKYRNFDPDKAMALLEEAGYFDRDGDGIREDAKGNKLDFKFTIIESSYRDHALIIQENLKAIGINTNIEFVDSAGQSATIYKQDFATDMFIWGWSPSYADPSTMLAAMLTSQIHGKSDCYWSNQEFDELWRLQGTQIDLDERIATVHRMQELIYEEAPYLVVLGKTRVQAYRGDKWKGWKHFPAKIGGIINYWSLLELSPKQ